MWGFKEIICFAFCTVNVLANVRIDPLVKTNIGLIRGLQASDGDYSMFLGIPYAKVRQDNPFAEAIPQDPFDDIFEAYDDSAVCPQITMDNRVLGTLDCLQLNIFVPNSANSQNPVPVLFWIHGGLFKLGSKQKDGFGPKFLVRHDIIVVTINYRLGPYGFMCIDTPDIPGNQGFKDQLLALRWIKENIEAFGGNSSRITITGESAGSMSIDFHLHAPYEKIFNNAILQSGNALVATFHAPIKNAPLLLAKYLGYETDNMDDAISFLARTDTNSVILAASAQNFIFKACVEQEFDNVDRFITQNWINQALPKVNDLPILIGFNSHEELVSYAPEGSIFHDKLIRNMLAISLNVDDEAFDGMEELVTKFYIGEEPISGNVRWEMIDFQSDFKFNHPTLRTIQKYIDYRAGNIFHYVFSYSGQRNIEKIRVNVTAGGAAHADELGYLFDMANLSGKPTVEDQLIIDRMTTMWANFAKYSDPTPELSDILTTKWTPITPGSLHYYLDINSELSSKTRAYTSRMTFWDLFYIVNYKLQRIYPGNNIVL